MARPAAIKVAAAGSGTAEKLLMSAPVENGVP
jgi:hypothetical protein